MLACTHCQASFEVVPEDLAFYDSISPSFGGQKYLIPPPTHCPDCRQQRRLASCNERFLYPGECGLCHQKTLTQFAPTSGQPYYCRECWHGDGWDPRSYGQDFDFSRPFFDQFFELQKRVPAQALHTDGTCINSDYIHYAGSAKNCYLIAHADFCEDCYYGYGFKNDVSCVDGFYNLHCELCYDGVDVHKCYGLIGSQDCMSCNSSAFLRDCIGCTNCFLCVGLRNKEYCFENKQLTKEEYQKRLAQVDTGSYVQYQYYKRRLGELEQTHPFKAYHGHNLENSFGDYLYNCKNTTYCFDCEDVESAKYCSQMVLGSKDIYDVYQFGSNLQQSYESAISGANGYRILFTMNAAMQPTELLYCYYMESSKHCFGCTSMHHAEYCILNKKYTKEEYEKLVPRIIEHMEKTGEWGEYFPISHSLFGYNKTTAQLYYPLTKEEALAEHFPWDDYETPRPQVTHVYQAADLPDNIADVSDEILSSAIACEATGKLFKITPQELQFYRTQKIPLPRRCPDQRHIDRFSRRNPRKFWQRPCMCRATDHDHAESCPAEFWTTYSPERSTIIYCEPCYQKTVY